MAATTKAELAQSLVDVIGLTGKDARELTDQFFELIKKSLTVGNEVKISGLGRFHLRDKNARPGRNPRTGEIIPVLPRRVVGFSCAQNLKIKVEQSVPVSRKEDL